MKCIHCQGEMVRKTAPFHIDRKGYHLLLDAIPAWVCNQCGEAYFEEAEVTAIQEVLHKIAPSTLRGKIKMKGIYFMILFALSTLIITGENSGSFSSVI